MSVLQSFEMGTSWNFPMPGKDDHAWLGVARLLAVAKIFNKEPSMCESFMNQDEALEEVKALGSSYSPECRQLSEELLTGVKESDENTANLVKEKCGNHPYTMRAFAKKRVDAQRESYERGHCPDGGFDVDVGHMYDGDDTFFDKVHCINITISSCQFYPLILYSSSLKVSYPIETLHPHILL